MPDSILPRSLHATIASLLWLLCLSGLALASEVCMVPFGANYLIFYVKCPDYCCKYKNASQYCCSDCRLSVNADSCTPEQLWRYILYVGLGIAGTVILCYLIVYLVKNCKEPVKRACCKQRTTRVQDPSISMTSASAWSGGPSRSRRIRQATATDSAAAADTDGADSCDHYCRYPQPPPPPAYADAAAIQCQREQRAATPPPNYSEETTQSGAAAAAAAAAAVNFDEPPPAYSEPTGDQQSQQLR